MSKIAMPAAVHFSFLSFDDALITVSRAADDRFAVGLSAILAILDDVALVVSDDYSTGVIHDKLLLEMVLCLFLWFFRGFLKVLAFVFVLVHILWPFPVDADDGIVAKRLAPIDAVKANGLLFIHSHKSLCSSSHACASFFFHDAWPRWMQ